MEKVILVGLDLQNGTDFLHSMEELEELAKACGMEVAGVTTQRMSAVNKAYYIGTGKVEQVRQLAQESGAALVVFDNALSPMQLRNLQRELGLAVMDRTTLILEIFARRAGTKEARLQVEIASLQYMLPRLAGLHDALSRQGGGSGALSNKGAGEKKLELDRRHIEARLSVLRRELAEVEKDRMTRRRRRMKSPLPLVGLVGYTNAGKSSVMNLMIEHYGAVSRDGRQEKKVTEQDMLFATLETTVRRIEGHPGKGFLLSDTVGFNSELPHHLVKAFRSTLEEAADADLLLQIIDCSDPCYRAHMAVTKQTLEELGAAKIPMLYVFNKMDLCTGDASQYPRREGNRIYMAAGRNIGTKLLLSTLEELLFCSRKECELLIPYEAGAVFAGLKEQTEILQYEYRGDGIYVKAALDEALWGRYGKYGV